MIGEPGERQLLVHTLLILTRVQLAQDQHAKAASTCARAVQIADGLAERELSAAAHRLQAEVNVAAAGAVQRASVPLL